MTPKKALFVSNMVMLSCIVLVNIILYHLWPLWHSENTQQQKSHMFYMVWVSLPFALLMLTNFFIKDSVNALMFIAFSAIFFLGIAVINYYYYMTVLSDGRSGLIFIVLPLLQLGGSLVTIIVATIINGVKRQ